MDNHSKIAEVWNYFKTRNKWYLLPIIILLVLLSSILILSEGSAVAPFIYAIF